MTAKEMWAAFAESNGITAGFEAWAFGSAADELAALVQKGIKTATASAFPLYEVDGEGLPQVGEYSVILDSKDQAVCVIHTTKVYVVPFTSVSAEHAYKEGEGDRSLAYWRQVHRDCFSEWMGEAGLSFDEETKVVCEEFEVVYQ